MFLGITPVFSVSNSLYFLTLPLVSVMRVIYRKIRHARYLYIKRNVEKVWGACYTLGTRYLSKNTVINFIIYLLKHFVIPSFKCFKNSPANIMTGVATIWFCAGIRNLSLHYIQTIPGLT